MEKLPLGVDRDLVSFLYQGDPAALGGLWGYVADDHSVGPAGEAPVSDQPDGVAQAGADQRRGGGKHFPHARPSLGSFVADDNDVTTHDLAGEDRAETFFF